MVTPWKYEKDADKKSKDNSGLVEPMKELIAFVQDVLKDEQSDEIIGKRSIYREFKSETRHRVFELMDLSLNKEEETRKMFLVRGLFVCMMEVGEDGVPLDVSYCIRIPNTPNLVTEKTMFENHALSANDFKEVVSDIKNSRQIKKEDYEKYVERAIERKINRRKKE